MNTQIETVVVYEQTETTIEEGTNAELLLGELDMVSGGAVVAVFG